jgi:uncharacterized lipoprotein YbaY
MLAALAGAAMPRGLPRLALAAATPIPAIPMATPGAMEGPVTVTGTIEFPDDVPTGPPATVYARIEDVSRADTPAVVLASVTLPAVPAPPPAGEDVTFSIPVASYDPRMSYTVRVHVDRDGDGRVSEGDLVSTSHHAVLTRGGGKEVTVPVSVV